MTAQPGTALVVGDDGQPAQQGTYRANFECIVPASASAANPARTGLYGHGLLGAADQVPGGSFRVAAAGNLVFCGTDLIGMSEADLGNAAAVIADLSTFNTLADRLLQGHLNTLFLGRLLVHRDGLGSDPAFQDGGQSMLTDDLVYYGISQGGIMGAATSAVAQDWKRVMLDVPAANYGLLLDRSVDFDPFRAVMDPAYPAAADQALALQLIQMLWDRGEANGYVQHLTSDPYAGHARASRCCCTSPSATTRWRTSPPRSRPARSGLQCIDRCSPTVARRRPSRSSTCPRSTPTRSRGRP